MLREILFAVVCSLLLAISGLYAPIGSVAALIVLAAALFLVLKKNVLSVILPLGIVFFVFVLPRGLSLLMLGSGEYFELFSINPENRSWVLSLVLSCGVMLVGYVLVDKSKIAAGGMRPHQRIEKKTLVIFSFLGLLFSLFFLVRYVGDVGGLAYLLENYNASLYFQIAESESTSAAKNLSIYFLVAGYMGYSSCIVMEKKVSAWWIFVAAYAVFAAILYIKREYLFEVLMCSFYVLYACGYLRSKAAILASGASAFLMLFFLYIFRSGDEGYFAAGLGDFLNTAEFWVLDQFSQVVQNGGELVGYDYGYRLLLAFAAPFTEFSSYRPLDNELVYWSTGVERWGVPPLIFGYIHLFGGWLLIPAVALLFGVVLALGERLIHTMVRDEMLAHILKMNIMVFAWFLFRNGDPVIAVFYTNRIFLLSMLIYGASRMVCSKMKDKSWAAA